MLGGDGGEEKENKEMSTYSQVLLRGLGCWKKMREKIGEKMF